MSDAIIIRPVMYSLGDRRRQYSHPARSERGVVFFRDAKITPDEQRTLVDSLGRLSAKPSTSGLHIHPLTKGGSELGDEISVISNKFVFDDKFKRNDKTILDRVVGKTLWVSGDDWGCVVIPGAV